MNSLKRLLIEHYYNTINLIDINSEILISKTKKTKSVHHDRQILIKVVNSIEKLNIFELDLNNEAKITKFCFFVQNDIFMGNLVILNRYLNDQSIQMINNYESNKENIYEILLFELIKKRSDNFLIDLSKPEDNYLSNLDIDGHYLLKKICKSTMDEIGSIINLQNVSSLMLRNVSFELDEFLLSHFSKLQSISIQSSEIHLLTKVENFINLVKVDLSFNMIKKIRFNNLINLKILNLKGNLIETIDDQMFRGLSKLEELDLKFNKLKEIKAESLNDLVNLLKLDLSKNGKMKFDFDFRRRLVNLRYLNLGENLIQNIDVDGLGNLEYLNLEIDSEQIPDMSKLSNLNILVLKNVKHFNLDKNLRKLQFLILKFDTDPFLNNSIDVRNICHLDKLVNIKIQSRSLSPSVEINNYFKNNFKDLNEIEINIHSNRECQILINLNPSQEPVGFLYDMKHLYSNTSYAHVANFVITFKNY
ncbi:insulin-like growth factor-binding complex acid labile subunit [Brachionus plicatilis]|uniref:Insulin-like growth factor-binding complex acid labile subunit n=1 Tax=Brachionus plicatilis TaxID=10195 RepID=A0A3M7PY17_BRAPC|nr:insulin-like growth factor-binding complex acid labile subunit [Brachionus plicatilis]